MNDCYCKPEDAPDTAAGYKSLSELVIDSGAERMTDDQWAAIGQWVVSGGSVVFIGGAGSLGYLDLPQAEQLSPLTQISLGALRRLSTPSAAGAVRADNVAIVQGRLVPGAWVQLSQGAVSLAVQRTLGAGCVSLITFNPLSEPIRSATGQPALVSAFLDGEPSAASLSSFIDQNAYGAEYEGYAGSYAPPGAMTSLAYAGGATGGKTNPFHVRLPPFGTVALILLIYFLLAVPITYFVLRRVGRLELAWLTTPILSLGFAFVFYQFAAGLYSAALTRRSSGAIAVAGGSDTGRYSGSTEVFFPRAGTYDLRVSGADAMESKTDNGGYGYGYDEQYGVQLDTVDLPEGLVADNYAVTNLAFRRLYYAGSENLSGTFTGNLRALNSSLSGSVTNSTSQTLQNAALWLPGSNIWYSLGTIEAGQTIRVHGESGPPGQYMLADSLLCHRFPSNNAESWLHLRSDSAAYLFAALPGSAVGPKIGKDVSDSSSVEAVISLPVGVGGTK